MASEGRADVALLPLAGMIMIGAASLWRAYRTTVAMYQGRERTRRRSAAGQAAPAALSAGAEGDRPTARNAIALGV